jgi:hypothetical protein
MHKKSMSAKNVINTPSRKSLLINSSQDLPLQEIVLFVSKAVILLFLVEAARKLRR